MPLLGDCEVVVVVLAEVSISLSGDDASGPADHKLCPLPGSLRVSVGAFVLEALLAAGNFGVEACGKESSIQTLTPSPGSFTEGLARTTGPAGADEAAAGQREKPLPGRLRAGVVGAEFVPIHRLWPNPGNRREGEESMRGLCIFTLYGVYEIGVPHGSAESKRGSPDFGAPLCDFASFHGPLNLQARS